MSRRDPYSSRRDPYESAPPPARARSRSQDSYSYSEDEPGSAWGNGALARAGVPDSRGNLQVAGTDYGYHYDQYYQQQAQYDPYRGYDPYGRPPAGSGYPQPGYPPPGYPPPPSGYAGGGARDDRENRYSHYGYYGHPGYPPPPGYAYPPPGYPPPHAYGHDPNRYASDPNRYASDRGGGRGRSRSRGRKGGGKRKGGGGTDGNRGGPQPRGDQKNEDGKKKKRAGGDEMEEEVLSGPKPDLKLSDVLAGFESRAKEKTASYFLQMVVDEGREEDMHSIFEALLPCVSRLSMDQFGNYLVKRFIGKCSDEQREALAQELKTDVLKLSNDKHGCRVIQKAVEVMKPEQQIAVVNELKSDVIGNIKSMHGNHVIQKCVEHMLPEHICFIVEAIDSNVELMAAHMYGCRVVQRLLERIPKEQGDGRLMLERMLDTLMKHLRKLMKDQHGNYVVQCILKEGTRIEDKREIIKTVIADPVDFAKNKCSSNVVERCLEICTEGPHKEELERDREALMHALIGKPSDPHAPLRDLITDKFGNFIVSKMIKHSRGDDRALLKRELELEEPNLRNSQSGKHILTTMQNEFGDRA